MRSGDLNLKILKEIGKLSEIEFLGVMKFLNISIVEETTNPIHQQKASSLEEPEKPKKLENVDVMTTGNIDLIDNNLLDIKSPRPFSQLIEDFIGVLEKLNRNQKRNLYRLIRKVTKKRNFKGNQNFLNSEGKNNE